MVTNISCIGKMGLNGKILVKKINGEITVTYRYSYIASYRHIEGNKAI